MGTLCSMLIGNDTVRAAIVEQIGESGGDWFADGKNEAFYGIMVGNWHAGRSLAPELFAKQLRDCRLPDMAARVYNIYPFIPTASGYQHYLDGLRDKRWLRYVTRTAADLLKKAEANSDDVAGILSAAEEALASITNRHFGATRQREISAIVEEVIDGFNDSEKILGLSTGYPSFDEAIGGLAPGAKIVIAGQISGGKSSLAECIVNNVCVTGGIPTALFSFEMSESQTVARLIQIRSEVSTLKLRRGEAELWEKTRYTEAAGEVAQAKLWIVKEHIGINGIRARIMQLKPRIVILDYLQIIPEATGKRENETNRLERMSRETKEMASQFGLTMIELSQLTEQTNQQGKRTGLRTKGSSSITADCDTLAIIEDLSDVKPGFPNKEIIIAKNRDGERGQRLPFVFKSSITKFVEKN